MEALYKFIFGGKSKYGKEIISSDTFRFSIRRSAFNLHESTLYFNAIASKSADAMLPLTSITLHVYGCKYYQSIDSMQPNDVIHNDYTIYRYKVRLSKFSILPQDDLRSEEEVILEFETNKSCKLECQRLKLAIIY
jgi:hypothetical protein